MWKALLDGMLPGLNGAMLYFGQLLVYHSSP